MGKSLYKNSWPTIAVMQQVYQDKLWGTNGCDFYSGEGSHHPILIEPYVDKMVSFLRSFPDPISVCDLGCGDFNIGRRLAPFTKRYVAVDIVPELIAFNHNHFSDKNVVFQCLDIAKKDLPKSDCAILRQVLQHLSNDEVAQIIKKLAQYKYVILTEHLPEGEFAPNIDIISGQGIRLKKQSGLDLLKPPFSMHVKKTEVMLSQSPISHPGIIMTTLLQLF